MALSRRLLGQRGALLRQVRGEVPVHGVRLVLTERAVPWRPAHEMEAVRVPVIPVVAAAAHFEPLDARGAAVARRPSGQLGAGADEVPLVGVPLPLGDAGPHPIIAGPEVLVPNDEGGV